MIRKSGNEISPISKADFLLNFDSLYYYVMINIMIKSVTMLFMIHAFLQAGLSQDKKNYTNR